MHPAHLEGAAWMVAAAPSKAAFYVVGAVLAGWAVLLAAFGVTHPEFPRSRVQGRFVMLMTALLVGSTMTVAILTAGSEGHKAAAQPGAAPTSNTLALTADPAGGLSYTVRHAALKAGADTIGFVNRSPVPHNVTIAQGSKTVVTTKTIQGATTRASVTLAPGAYTFYCSVDEHRQLGMQGTLTVR